MAHTREGDGHPSTSQGVGKRSNRGSITHSASHGQRALRTLRGHQRHGVHGLTETLRMEGAAVGGLNQEMYQKVYF